MLGVVAGDFGADMALGPAGEIRRVQRRARKKVTILCSTRSGTLLERESDHRSNLKTESQI